MTRYRRRHQLLHSIVLLLVFPFSMVAGAYALFSQNLSLSATTSGVAYVSNQSILMTYTKVQSGTSPYTYTMNMTVKNNAAKATTVWQVTVTVPADTTSISCPATVTCALSGTSLTILSNTNGALAIGGTTTVSFSFVTATNGYTLQNVSTYANYTSAYATITGLSVNTAVGTRTKTGQNYFWPLTVTVTNNSGQPIGGWRATISPFSTTYTITGLPTGVTSTIGTTLRLTGASELATGASYQFTATVGTARTTTWRVTTATVQGKS